MTISMLTTPTSWEQANNAVFRTNWKAVVIHSSTARNGESKRCKIVTTKYGKIVSYISSINDSTSISKSILLISKQLTDWSIASWSSKTRVDSIHVYKEGSQSTSMMVVMFLRITFAEPRTIYKTFITVMKMYR